MHICRCEGESSALGQQRAVGNWCILKRDVPEYPNRHFFNDDQSCMNCACNSSKFRKHCSTPPARRNSSHIKHIIGLNLVHAILDDHGWMMLLFVAAAQRLKTCVACAWRSGRPSSERRSEHRVHGSGGFTGDTGLPLAWRSRPREETE
jgi:hypothetical protein